MGRPDGAARRAGVNAFGFGGINAHVILEEAPGRQRAAAPPVPRNSPLRTAEGERTADPLRAEEPDRTPRAAVPERTARAAVRDRTARAAVPERTPRTARADGRTEADGRTGADGAHGGTGADRTAHRGLSRRTRREITERGGGGHGRGHGPARRRRSLPPRPARPHPAAPRPGRQDPGARAALAGTRRGVVHPEPLLRAVRPGDGSAAGLRVPGAGGRSAAARGRHRRPVVPAPPHGLRRQRPGRTSRRLPGRRPAARPRPGRTGHRSRPVDRPQPRGMDRHGGRRDVSAPGRGHLPRLAAARLPRRTRPGLRGTGLRRRTGGRGAGGPGAGRGQPRQLPAPVGDLRSSRATGRGREQTRPAGCTGPGDALPLRLPHADVGALPRPGRRRLRRVAAAGPAPPRMVGHDRRPLPPTSP